MQLRAAVLVGSVVFGSSAWAQGEPPSAPPPAVDPRADAPRPEPMRAEVREPSEEKWNLGAGVSFNSALFSSLSPAAPQAQVAIEHRLGFDTWLTLGALATYDHSSGDGVGALPNAGIGSSISIGSFTSAVNGNNSSAALGATVGIRQVVNPGGVVEVSVAADAFVGYLRASGTATSQLQSVNFDGSSQTTRQIVDASQDSLRYGVAAGVVAEHKLTDRLAVRAELGLLNAALGSDSNDTKTTPQTGSATESKTSSSTVHVGLQPGAGLSLRFGF